MKTLYEFLKSHGFDNIQNSVNIGSNGTVDPNRLQIVLEYMTKEGWQEITLDETIIVNPGDRIRYITNDKPPNPFSTKRVAENDRYDKLFTQAPKNKFRTGGWVIKVDTTVEKPYILYRPHVAQIGPQSIQFEYIDRLFYLPRGGEASGGNKKVKYKRPDEITDYPVCLNIERIGPNGNKFKETVTVYYAKDESKRSRFMSTEKFKKATRNGFEFID